MRGQDGRQDIGPEPTENAPRHGWQVVRVPAPCLRVEQSRIQRWNTLAVDVLSAKADSTEADVGHVKQCAVLIVARTCNSGLQHEGRVDTMNGWEEWVGRIELRKARFHDQEQPAYISRFPMTSPLLSIRSPILESLAKISMDLAGLEYPSYS